MRGVALPPTYTKRAIWFTNHISIIEYFNKAIGIEFEKGKVFRGCRIIPSSYPSYPSRRFLILFYYGDNKMFDYVNIKYIQCPTKKGFPLSYCRLSPKRKEFVDKARMWYEKDHIAALLLGDISPKSSVYSFLRGELSELRLVRVISSFL